MALKWHLKWELVKEEMGCGGLLAIFYLLTYLADATAADDANQPRRDVWVSNKAWLRIVCWRSQGKDIKLR